MEPARADHPPGSLGIKKKKYQSHGEAVDGRDGGGDEEVDGR